MRFGLSTRSRIGLGALVLLLGLTGCGRREAPQVPSAETPELTATPDGFRPTLERVHTALKELEASQSDRWMSADPVSPAKPDLAAVERRTPNLETELRDRLRELGPLIPPALERARALEPRVRELQTAVAETLGQLRHLAYDAPARPEWQQRLNNLESRLKPLQTAYESILLPLADLTNRLGRVKQLEELLTARKQFPAPDSSLEAVVRFHPDRPAPEGEFLHVADILLMLLERRWVGTNASGQTVHLRFQEPEVTETTYTAKEVVMEPQDKSGKAMAPKTGLALRGEKQVFVFDFILAESTGPVSVAGAFLGTNRMRLIFPADTWGTIDFQIDWGSASAH